MRGRWALRTNHFSLTISLISTHPVNKFQIIKYAQSALKLPEHKSETWIWTRSLLFGRKINDENGLMVTRSFLGEFAFEEFGLRKKIYISFALTLLRRYCFHLRTNGKSCYQFAFEFDFRFLSKTHWFLINLQIGRFKSLFWLNIR